MKILSLSPNPSDGTSWYRCSGPLNRLEKDYDDVSYIEYGSNDVHWDILGRFDVLYIQRAHTLWHLRLMNKAAFMGLKIWVDYDDLLWDLPYMHRNYFDYLNNDVQNAIKGIMTMQPEVLLITVSTQYLADRIRKDFNEKANVHVVPNALDEKMFLHRMEFAQDAQIIGWRGSDTHDLDFLDHIGELSSITRRYKWDYIGYVPKAISAYTDNVEFTRPVNILEYFAHITTARKWKMFFVCLADNGFNMAKSNIAWLEATIAGSVCLAPRMPEWNKAACYCYGDDEKSLVQMINIVMNDGEAERKDLWRVSVDIIKKKYSLGKQNKLRYQLLTNHLKN